MIGLDEIRLQNAADRAMCDLRDALDRRKPDKAEISAAREKLRQANAALDEFITRTKQRGGCCG
jgi:hypothetical protein